MGSRVILLAGLVLLCLRGATAATNCNVGCSCVAFQPLSRSLTCSHECSEENVTVYWNMNRGGSNSYNITFWYDEGSQHRSDSSLTGTILQQMRATPDGELMIDSVSPHVHDADYTCWAVRTSNRTQCGVKDFFHLTVVSLFTDISEKPMVPPNKDDYNAKYGSLLVACIDGTTPGISEVGTYWEKKAVTVENAQNVSTECPTCIDCSVDAIAQYLEMDSVKERLQNGYSHSAFFISTKHKMLEEKDYTKCLSIKNVYVSFLVIKEVAQEDRGDWTVGVTSASNALQTGTFTIYPSYREIETAIETIKDVDLIPTENSYLVCKANHTIDFDSGLHWEFKQPGRSVITLSTNVTVIQSAPSDANLTTDPVEIPDETLRELCSQYRAMLDDKNIAFSLNYAPDNLLRYNSMEEGHEHALVQRRLLVLVMCNVGNQQSGIYSCIAPPQGNVRSAEESLNVNVLPQSSPHTPTQVDVGPIIGVVVTAVIIIVVIIFIVFFGIRRYRQLKYEAMQMRPMSIPLAATQLTNAINHAFASFSPIGSPMYDKLEFPRENLMLLEVIGEGQFGQVWRARAVGICNEDSRNIVAVKTLKENYRDSDYFDLRSELDIMRSMEPHPNIINLLGVCSESGAGNLCILMEYAAYGSMKDYLAYCRRVMQAHAEGLTSPTLQEAYPSAASSHGAIIRQSMLMGEYPQLQPLGMSVPGNSDFSGEGLGFAGREGGGERGEGNDYLYDPMVAARTRRLIHLLKAEGYAPEGQEDGGVTYNHLAAGGAEAAGVSLYDRLYPNSNCVYRPCLETYNYACYRGAQQQRRGNAEQEYYNAAASGIGEAGDGELDEAKMVLDANPATPGPLVPTEDRAQLIRASPTPQVLITDGPSTPPPSASVSTPVRSKTKLGPVLSSPQISSQDHLNKAGGLASLSASQDNVFESSSNLMVTASKEHMRESMISFPDGYIYAPPLGEGETEGAAIMTGAVGEGGRGRGLEGREEMEEAKREKTPAPIMEDMITDLDMIDFALQIARGMDHLQRMQCVHRDLAARNVLISEDFTLKIGDFGLARDLSDKDYYRKVTPGRLPARWMAPESLEERTHTFQSDVWSYGVVLWEILTYGEVPYRGQPEANDCDHLAHHLRCGNRLIPPPNTSDEFRDMLTSCWMLNPDKRPTFSEIMSILDNQLSAAHGYLTMASAPVERSSLYDQGGSANPSPRLQKRKAMLQKLDKLHGADRPVSLQPGAFSKSKLGKSPSLPIAEPLKTSPSPSALPPPNGNSHVSPYLLPTPTLKVPGGGTLLLAIPPGSSPSSGHFHKFGSNPELSLSGRESPVEPVERAKNVTAVKANGHAPNGTILESIETQL